MEEIWKDIVGYEGLYQVSNFGNVLSLNYGNRGYAKQLVPKVNNSGRLWVELTNHGDKKQFLIHRLVGNMFIPNPMGLPQINHKDENPMNNRADNLEWCDQKYNIRYSLSRHPERKVNSTRKSPYPTGDLWHDIHKSHTGGWKNGPKDKKAVLQYTVDMQLCKEWENIRTVCKENGWNQTSIKECCIGKRKTAYGFRWQYAI